VDRTQHIEAGGAGQREIQQQRVGLTEAAEAERVGGGRRNERMEASGRLGPVNRLIIQRLTVIGPPRGTTDIAEFAPPQSLKEQPCGQRLIKQLRRRPSRLRNHIRAFS